MTLPSIPSVSPLCLCASLASSTLAHATGTLTSPSLFRLDPAILLPLALSAFLYALGLHKLYASSRKYAGIRRWEAACFWAGWAFLALALASPLHPLGGLLFSAHMTQHEILMLLAAPLLVLGRPLVVYLWALPLDWSRDIARFTSARVWRRIWRFFSHPFTAFLLHAAALWIWHIPALFQATLADDLVHALQHASFLGTALLFWWSIIHHRHPAAHGLAVLYLFTTALHSGLLGALLTFAPTLLYPAYAPFTPDFGLSPLEDQQLGGLIMWIPAGLTYIAAALLFTTAWLKHSKHVVPPLGGLCAPPPLPPNVTPHSNP